MHVPDGILSGPVLLASAALSALAVGTSASRSRGRMGSRAVAMLGVTGAFVFAAQMLNFPVAGGTSGHLVGGVLAAVLLGPSAAVVVMSAVLVLQCLAFGDGGLLALGANALNMAVIHPVVGYATYSAIARRGARGGSTHRGVQIAGAAFGAWVATIASAWVCSGELVLSRVGAPGVVLFAMTSVHGVVGLGEGLVTALVLGAVLRVRPDLSYGAASTASPAGVASAALLGFATSMALALFVSPFACTWPDGLERLTARVGFEPSRARIFIAPMNGYSLHAIPTFGWSAAIAAFLGTLAVFGSCCALGWWLSPRRRPETQDAAVSAEL